MEIDVFISYHTASSRSIVEAVVNKLENAGVRCWYAPRDVVGAYAASIVQAIKACSVFLLMLNKPASESPQVLNELNMVTDRLSAKEDVSIVPFHLADEEISPEAQYYVRRMHWVDAIKPPLSDRIDELAEKILYLLVRESAVNKAAVSAPAKGDYCLQSNLPQARLIFDGRDGLLEEIRAHFQSGERVLYLEGVGGIGKSELAKHYALQNRADYDHIIFVTYAGSLKKLVCDSSAIVIDNMEQKPGETEDEFFSRKWKIFQSLTNERTLLIMDNFDVENDPDLDTFQAGNHRIIFTTRCKHDNAHTVRVTAIEDAGTLFHIFEENYGAPIEEEDRPYLEELFRLIENHTYTIELLAKQMDASFLTGEELLELFKKGQLQSGVSETVTGREGQRNVFDHIRAVFSTSGLGVEEQQVLRQLSLVGLQGIPAARFKEWAELDSFEIVNRLEKMSWLRRERSRERRLSLHPLVVEVVQASLKPDLENCGDFVERICDFTFTAWFRPVAENITVCENVLAVLKYFAPFALLDNCKVQCFESMTGYLWQMARFDDSIHYSELLYQTCLKQYGEASMITGFMAKSVAGCYFNSQRLQESAPWYKRGLECMLLSGAEETEDLAMSYEKVGRCYTWEYEQALERAEQYFMKSLEIRQRLEEALLRGETKTMFHTREHYDLSLARIRIGETYMEMGRMYQIAQDFLKGLECADKYEQYGGYTETNNPSGYAYACFDRGVCHYHLGMEAKARDEEDTARTELKAAAEQLETALRINSRMRGDIAIDTIDNREYLADTFAAMERTAEAVEQYEAEKTALENLFGADCDRIQHVEQKICGLRR